MPETPVFSTAAVAAPHPRASAIGQAILASGGNAIEAVVAMAATCAVVLPHLNGLGGDGFFLVREPRGRVHGIEAVGPAGALATIARYRQREYEAVPTQGADATVTVAGVVAGWSLALELSRALGGQMPLDMLLTDAVALARDGYDVVPSEGRLKLSPTLIADPSFARTFLQDGKPAVAGDRRLLPRLADTLERLSHAGLADFYRGDVGREIALDLERIDSPIGRRDLETYRARSVEPLTVGLQGATLYNLPAPSVGFASLMALTIADRLGVGSSESVLAHHGLIEATRRALVLADRRITDPREMEADLADLLAGGLPEHEALQIDRSRAGTSALPTGTEGDGIWIGCIDKDGLAVSFAQSVDGSFGSGIVLPRTGIHWHNRGRAFSLDPSRLNPLVPGRKPPHSLNPALAVFADHRVLTYGVVGAQTQGQILSRYADLAAGPADTLAAPRWWLARRDDSETVLRVEEGFDTSFMRGLSRLGHQVEDVAAGEAALPGAGMIVKHARNGRVEASHDPRGEGEVMGL
ncbi:gamma-glutamyltransferase family protein [Microvirga antarctica]|uniref:gamma-glutamyltransferase family protein n=1 Tax=Microvirga antarctica TaxID=2819233 RepID=UPI001B3129B9|nr:gamma-glutamyltransferase [Microvirga antarctica]